MKFNFFELPKDKYKYHELHYVYTSDKLYTLDVTSSADNFSCNFKRTKLETPYTHDSYDTLYEDYWQDCTAYGVTVDDSDEIVAYLELSREEWNDRLRITNLLVKEDLRGLGIGSFLMEKTKEIAQNEDRRIIVLETQSCNVPAIDFYLKHGFVFCGTNLYFYSNIDKEENEIMLEMAFLY